MFEKASRMKLRFLYKGASSTEDLWDLSVEELDSIYSALCAKQESTKKATLLSTRTRENSIIDLQIDIVKHIVEVKLKEAENRAAAKERKAKRDKIMERLAAAQDAEMDKLSIAELQKMLDEADKED